MAKRGKAAKVAGTAAAQQPARSTAVSTARVAPVEAANGPSYPAVTQRAPEQAAGNVAVTWRPAGNGAGELLVAYEGPLAPAHEALLARTGTRRAGGRPWSETRDVRLVREAPHRFVGVIAVPTGGPVEAIELAFHAGDAWDNGGRAPLGYYEWTAREQRVEAR